jgi:hypothetical protein
MKPSCLSCQHSRPFSPSGTRAQVKYRCSVFLFLVDASTVPGVTVGCDHFQEPELPFAFQDAEPMPVHLL